MKQIGNRRFQTIGHESLGFYQYFPVSRTRLIWPLSVIGNFSIMNFRTTVGCNRKVTTFQVQEKHDGTEAM